MGCKFSKITCLVPENPKMAKVVPGKFWNFENWKNTKMVLEILVIGNFDTYENFGKVSFSALGFVKIAILVLDFIQPQTDP